MNPVWLYTHSNNEPGFEWLSSGFPATDGALGWFVPNIADHFPETNTDTDINWGSMASRDFNWSMCQRQRSEGDMAAQTGGEFVSVAAKHVMEGSRRSDDRCI